MSGMAVRDMRRDDLAALSVVLDETGLFPPDMLEGMAAPWFADQGDAVWLVAERDGAVVGLCHAIPEALTEGTWNLLALAVHPSHQGHGVAAALIGAAETALLARSARLVVVDTAGGDDYAIARRLYARCGYDEEARIRDFWADGVDKVTFRKRLGASGG